MMTMFVSRTRAKVRVSAFPGQYITLLSAESTTQNITEVTATGSEITCPYSAFSDDDGNFEIEILEEDGLTSKNAKVGVLAFKTDVFDRADESIFQNKHRRPYTVTPISSPPPSPHSPHLPPGTLDVDGYVGLGLCGRLSHDSDCASGLTPRFCSYCYKIPSSATGGSSASLGASTSPTSPPPSPPAEFTQADEDDNTVISKEEFADYARSRSEYSDVFVVIPDEFWDIFDADGTNSLSMTEFMSAVSAFDQGYVYGMPWLVYSLGETEYLTDFYVGASSNSDRRVPCYRNRSRLRISVCQLQAPHGKCGMKL